MTNQQGLYREGKLSAAAGADTIKMRPEFGLCEWFGAAPFEHPQPAEPELLKDLIPAYDETYVTKYRPAIKGETYEGLQQRVADGMAAIIRQCDAEGKKTVVVCTHAAVVIVLGRILTGKIPQDIETDDFQAFTCGLSVYQRDRTSSDDDASSSSQGGNSSE